MYGIKAEYRAASQEDRRVYNILTKYFSLRREWDICLPGILIA
jgi:hypothetical protein